MSVMEGAECVRAFQEREAAFADMHVCAACGVRDPELSYEAHNLGDLPQSHWMRVDQGAMARLDAAPPFELLKRRPEGGAAWPREQMRRRDLHNIFEHDGRHYHAVGEAVRPGGWFLLLSESKCGRRKR